jgi:hypothetical protein
MVLRWKPTFPDDVDGRLHLRVFARVYRVQGGQDQDCFRWYLKDVSVSAGVQLRGIEYTRREAQEAANFRFQQWLRWAGLREASVRARQQFTLPFHSTPQSEGTKRAWKARSAAVASS